MARVSPMKKLWKMTPNSRIEIPCKSQKQRGAGREQGYLLMLDTRGWTDQNLRDCIPAHLLSLPDPPLVVEARVLAS